MVQLAKIDVSKIDKTRLFKGAKGVYLDLVIIETPNGKYGTHMIKQSAPKGTEMPILGNILLPRASAETAKAGFDSMKSAADNNPGEDVPF